MSENTGSWDRDFIHQNLVGVIDFRGGHAVHAIQGNRSAYAPVPCVNGDPIQLARAYTAFGIRQIYIADLDAIQTQSAPSTWLNRIADSLESEIELLIDIGWRGDEPASVKRSIQAISDRLPRASWIAAGEAAISTDALTALSKLIPASRLMLGLDYHDDKWMSNKVTESDWLDIASKHCPRGAVVLDLKAVGSASGPYTAQRCRKLKNRFPDWQIISGGGIRCQADARVLMEAGCQSCLVATSIHPLLNT